MGLIFYNIHTEETPSGARPPFLSSIARSALSFEKMRILSRRKALRPLGFQYKIKIRQIKGFSLQFHFSGQRKSQTGIRSSSSGCTTIRTAKPGRRFPNGPRDKIHFPSGVRVRNEFLFTSIRETNEEGGFAATSGRTGEKTHATARCPRRDRNRPPTGPFQRAAGYGLFGRERMPAPSESNFVQRVPEDPAPVDDTVADDPHALGFEPVAHPMRTAESMPAGKAPPAVRDAVGGNGRIIATPHRPAHQTRMERIAQGSGNRSVGRNASRRHGRYDVVHGAFEFLIVRFRHFSFGIPPPDHDS